MATGTGERGRQTRENVNSRQRTAATGTSASPAPPTPTPHTLDAATVRRWCERALRGLGEAREALDASNVYPVADGDTGTNLYLTLESAAQTVEASWAGEPSTAQALQAMAHGALIGARGNSGTILAQVLRGMAEVYARAADGGTGPTAVERGTAAPTDTAPNPDDTPAAQGASPGALLGAALRHAADTAYQAVAHPVEGTMLTVAAAAADAAQAALATGPATGQRVAAAPVGAVDPVAVARAACHGAHEALARTPGQLPALDRAGVVDAGGSGLTTVLAALADVLLGDDALRVGGEDTSRGDGTTAGGERPPSAPPARRRPTGAPEATDAPGVAASYEVTYLLDASDAAVARLRERLDALGDSLVVVGGDGLWQVHIHTPDAGAAVEEGVRAGRPHRIRVTQLVTSAPSEDTPVAGCRGPVDDPGAKPTERGAVPAREGRVVLAVVPGQGLADICRDAGAEVVAVSPDTSPASGELAAAVQRRGAREVVLLPNHPDLHHTGAVAAERLREDGLRAALVPTRSPVQGLAALAVHQPERRFDEDVVAMTAAAGATRHAEFVVATARSWTTAGVCERGDVLGLVEGDVAVIGAELADTAVAVLDRMLAAGGELVTVVLGSGVSDTLAERLAEHVRQHHLAVDTVVYRGGQPAPLLIGVE